ncbi:MAG: hypothetical protein ABSC71_11005 [Candidatus Acidiferrales bacterium]|jgi:hypothetical protein
MKIKGWLAMGISFVALGACFCITNQAIYGWTQNGKREGTKPKDITCNCDKNVTIYIDDSATDKTKVVERDTPVCAGADSTVTWSTLHGTVFSVQFSSDSDEGTPFDTSSIPSSAGGAVTKTGVNLASNKSHAISSFKYALQVGPPGPSQITVDPHIIVIGNKGFFTSKAKGN